MIIILYTVKNVRTKEEIELCGQFVDTDHFRKFQKVEEYRNWVIIRSKIIKETI